MKLLLKAILRAVRRAMRAAARGAAGVGAFVGGVVDGLFAGGYVEEFEDDELIRVEDSQARQETTEAVSRPAHPEWTPSVLVRRAAALRDAGQPFADVFDDTDPEQKRLRIYVESLDESALRAIRHMPEHTLARHLDVSDFCAAGLRPIGRQIALAREEEASRKVAQEAAAGRKRRGTPVSDAIVSGRRMTLDDFVQANRRRALA